MGDVSMDLKRSCPRKCLTLTGKGRAHSMTEEWSVSGTLGPYMPLETYGHDPYSVQW